MVPGTRCFEKSFKQLRFDLSHRKPCKTLDIGLNGNAVSADPLGRILQLNTFHPEHGIVVAAAYEQFDGRRFYDPGYVRDYRARMLKMIETGRPGFGLRFEGLVKHVCIEIQGSNLALVQFQQQDGVSVLMTLQIQDNGELIQSAVISSTASSMRHIRYTLDLGISVNRASYGQLTEGGPIPIPASENNLKILDNGRHFAIVNPYLNTHLEGRLEMDGKLVKLEHIRNGTFRGTPVVASLPGLLEIAPSSSKTLTSRFRLLPDTVVHEDFHILGSGKVPLPASRLTWKYEDNDAMFIIRRNLEYILGNCAIPVSDTEVCLITDHVALPLGWNRDNYWQVRFLLDVYRHIDRLAFPEAAREYRAVIRRTVKGHLSWVFHLAQRPFGFWHRSYLVTGQPKDGPVFQLDQQCYPLLELCDFVDEFPDESAFVKGLLDGDTISQIIRLIESKRDPGTGLCPTDETPGDDAVEYPFHFSSHVLLWYTLSRMIRLSEATGQTSSWDDHKLHSLAHDVRLTTLRHFLTVMPQTNRPIFAYLTDGQGRHTVYHDANDIPTLFAPLWNFLESTTELEIWMSTMDFGTSPANAKGYCAGSPFGGLGSVHTSGPWPLGYFQEFVYAQMTDNLLAEQEAWRKIRAAMLWDGLFSEAVDCRTAECTSKAWFSWPGAMIGSALLRTNSKRRYLQN